MPKSPSISKPETEPTKSTPHAGPNSRIGATRIKRIEREKENSPLEKLKKVFK